MKLLFLPFSFTLVILFGLLLITAATLSTLLSSLASLVAFVIVKLLMWQESELLVKFTTILGTNKNTEEETK